MVICAGCERRLPEHSYTHSFPSYLKRQVDAITKPSNTALFDAAEKNYYHLGCLRDIVDDSGASCTDECIPCSLVPGRKIVLKPEIFGKPVNVESWNSHFVRTLHTSYGRAIPVVKVAAVAAAYLNRETYMGMFGTYALASIVMDLPSVKKISARVYKVAYEAYQGVDLTPRLDRRVTRFLY